MSAIISTKRTLDIQFATQGIDVGTFTWKLNDPDGSITTVTQIRRSFGFDAAGEPSTDTGLFGNLYQDGLRLCTKTGDTLTAIEAAKKVEVITTKEDLPI